VSAAPLPLVALGAPILTDPEADLVARAANGEAEAFGCLYARHLPVIYRYALARLGDVSEAEDLVEAVFLRAWEALPTYRVGEFSFSAWLHRVAQSLVDEHTRGRQSDESLAEGLANPNLLEDPGEWPEEVVLASERREWVQGALARLRPEYRQILALRFISGLSHGEAAQVLGVSPGSVRVLQHRALKALMAGLQDERG
jgi:RNA polymerase sigma-70 factor (ECF subfamily)